MGSIKAQSLAESAHSADFRIFLKFKAPYLENGKSDHSKGHIFFAQFFDADNGEIVFFSKIVILQVVPGVRNLPIFDERSR